MEKRKTDHTFLRRISDGIGRINEGVGRAVGWLTTILVVLVCFDVVTRYLLNDTQTWISEMEWHLFALIFLLGAGFTFKHDRHVRVDLFYANFSRRDKALVDLVGGLVFLIPWSILILVVAVNYSLVSFKVGETSPDPGGLPARYLIKFSIAVGMFLLLLQGIASVIDAALVLREKEFDRE